MIGISRERRDVSTGLSEGFMPTKGNPDTTDEPGETQAAKANSKRNRVALRLLEVQRGAEGTTGL